MEKELTSFAVRPDMTEAVEKAAKKLKIRITNKGDGKYEAELTPALLRRLLADADCIRETCLIPAGSMAHFQRLEGRLSELTKEWHRTSFVVRTEDRPLFARFSVRKGAA